MYAVLVVVVVDGMVFIGVVEACRWVVIVVVLGEVVGVVGKEGVGARGGRGSGICGASGHSVVVV